MSTRLPSSTLFPYTTLFRSELCQWNIQFGSLSENDGPLNEVLQFANIAGPGIAGQGLHRPLGDGFDLLLHSARQARDKVMDQKRDIAWALTQRRNFDWENIQA